MEEGRERQIELIFAFRNAELIKVFGYVSVCLPDLLAC